MKKNEILGSVIAFIIIGLILFFNWQVISVFLLLALAIFAVVGGILYLVSIVSEPGSGKDPTTYKIIGDNKKKIHTAISFLFFLKMKIAGLVKKVIHNMLKAYVPIRDVI